MKKSLLISMVIATMVSPFAVGQSMPDNPMQNNKALSANYKYIVRVNNLSNKDSIVMRNGQIDAIINSGAKRGWGDLGIAILNSYKSSLTQKTVSASAGLIGLGVSYITELVQKNSKDFESWSKAMKEQCTYTKNLSSDEQIDDFYYLPSKKGALDPRDLKFNGFSCRNFIETQNQADKTRKGHEIFYVSCKLRTDSIGINHMANHSKFMLEVDSLIFYPKYCNIPNLPNKDHSQKNDIYNFSKLTNLEFNMNVKVLSSWVNEAIMVTTDQVLGEFVINARINKEAMSVDENGDSVFIFDKNNPLSKSLVSIIGDSFIVPRSFVGTNTEKVWGTGQYKLQIEVSESCQLNAKHYKIQDIGNAEAVSFANLPGYKKWDKKIWKEEWRQMKSRKEGASFLENAWKTIKTAYIGNDWVKELVDPAATVIYQHETQALYNLLDFDASTVSTISTSQQKAANTGSQSAAPPQK